MARSRPASQPTTKPRSDAYVGLLAISLLAQITGAVFFFLDWNQYPTTKPKDPDPPGVVAPASGGQPAGGQQGGQGGAQQGAQQGAQAGAQQGQQAGMMGGKMP